MVEASQRRSAQVPFCCIAPPRILEKISREGSDAARKAAIYSISTSAAIRSRRSALGRVMRDANLDIHSLASLAPPPGENRTVYDAEHSSTGGLPGKRIRGEGDPESNDKAVNEAFDGAGTTYDFYKNVFGRNSIDGKGLEMISSVHFQRDLDNAFWDGGRMLYGDGSGEIFKKGSLTETLDVIGHELTHGVTQFTAGLAYSKQSGALNESFSDVFGIMVKQYHLKQTADEADWLIGAGALGKALKGKALRSMAEPGTAFDGDDQPGHMKDYMDLPDDGDPANDSGGVHINSGIPNHAFYLAAMAIGGNAWEKAGKIWYVTLTEHIQFKSGFKETAEATVAVAGKLFGADGPEEKAVKGAWQQVGVL